MKIGPNPAWIGIQSRPSWPPTSTCRDGLLAPPSSQYQASMSAAGLTDCPSPDDPPEESRSDATGLDPPPAPLSAADSGSPNPPSSAPAPACATARLPPDDPGKSRSR